MSFNFNSSCNNSLQPKIKNILSISPITFKTSALPASAPVGRPQNIKVRLFNKYFPKYLKNFFLITKHYPIISKVKRIKVIRNFQAQPNLSFHSEWRQLLGNKMKCIKSQGTYQQSPRQIFQKIKHFTRLESFTFQTSESSRSKPQIEHPYTIKTWKMLRGLPKLKRLEIMQLSKNQKRSIELLNSSPKLLNSLTSIRISLAQNPPKDFTELLTIIQSQKNLLRNITTLYIGTFSSPAHYESFLNFSNSCSKLKNLAFEFTNREITRGCLKGRSFSRESCPVNINYLQALKTFENLKVLSIDIADTFTFLNDFALPPSVQRLRLHFEESLSPHIVSQILALDTTENASGRLIFEQSPTFLKFYENFLHLHDFETFHLLWDSSLNNTVYKYQTYFSQTIFKRIPSLKNLTSTYQSTYSSGLNYFPLHREIRDLDLPQFFESLAHFGNSLQELEIGNEHIIYSKFDLLALRGKFPSLSTIRFTGTLAGEIDSDPEPVGSFLEQLISLGDSINFIKLKTMTKNTVKLLVSLLQDLNKINKESQAKIELRIKSSNRANLQGLGEEFNDVINELKTEKYVRVKRANLKLYMGAASGKMQEFFKVYKEKFDDFEILPIGSCF